MFTPITVIVILNVVQQSAAASKEKQHLLEDLVGKFNNVISANEQRNKKTESLALYKELKRDLTNDLLSNNAEKRSSSLPISESLKKIWKSEERQVEDILNEALEIKRVALPPLRKNWGRETNVRYTTLHELVNDLLAEDEGKKREDYQVFLHRRNALLEKLKKHKI